MSKHEYIIKSFGQKYPDDAVRFCTSITLPNNGIVIAEMAAEEYFKKRTGRGNSWPLDFEIYINGSSIGIFSVEIMTIFNAFKKRDEK
ncbi:hypothetical protein LGZ99_17380 [Photorhabdus temperata]|uniref:Uncharacterized protein n=1 Tax=Photorhabdus temperata subsp. temperata Meg1 TaxID=1393735 RepID=A0A081RW05_PHOTE|nr:hypothetical protein [Photorhabdus temperata]KER02858.1 hypothetical protein MEG1DRAFT_02587 [Photorhabdus temperata subsp. temperata Meg1]MCT8348910.1 hypothetical protein [Photorhabdus temperata]